MGETSKQAKLVNYFNNRLGTCVQLVAATVNFYSSQAVEFQMGKRADAVNLQQPLQLSIPL